MRLALIGIALFASLVLVGAPLLGSPPVVRLPAVLVPAIALALAARRAFRGPGFLPPADWQPSPRMVWSGAAVTGLFLFWYILTRFHSGEINAVDFTVYYDRPCFQTVHGRPLFVEASDSPGYSNRSELADHAYWGMLALCAPYALAATPLWLHLFSALAIVGGALHTLRILQRLGGGGVLASASALAFVLNDNTARTLNYGFHPEVFYAWFIPWMIHAGLRGARRSFLCAILATVLVKEDAFLPIFAASLALALHGFRRLSAGDRLLFLVLPTVLALSNLAAFYGIVVPLLTGESRPTYAHFWGNYGETPSRAVQGMLLDPGRVLRSVLTSGIYRVLQPHLFLPLVGWRWTLGIVPTVVLFGASANEQVRDFGIYYAICLMPFLVIGASWGALVLFRRLIGDTAEAQRAAAVLVLGGALLVGSGHRGYSLRPWKAEIAAVPEALSRLRDERVVLVQSGLFPHAGYDERFLLLTPETLASPANAGAAMLLAPDVGAYPFRSFELRQIGGRRPPIGPMPPGLLAIRNEVAPLTGQEPQAPSLAEPVLTREEKRHRRRSRQ